MNPFEAYMVLGAHPGMGDEAIKRCHRERSRQYHPDRPGGNAEKFVEAQEAYSLVATRPARRALSVRLSTLGDPCEDCKGTGIRVHRKGFRVTGSEPCPTCRRTGYLERSRR